MLSQHHQYVAFFHSEQTPMRQNAGYQSRACRVISDYVTDTATLSYMKTYKHSFWNGINYVCPTIHDHFVSK